MGLRGARAATTVIWGLIRRHHVSSVIFAQSVILTQSCATHTVFASLTQFCLSFSDDVPPSFLFASACELLG